MNRKFVWLWAYEKTSDGTLYINVTLDHRLADLIRAGYDFAGQ